MWFELIEKIIKYLILFLIGVLLFIVIHKVYKKCIDGFSISAQSVSDLFKHDDDYVSNTIVLDLDKGQLFTEGKINIIYLRQVFMTYFENYNIEELFTPHHILNYDNITYTYDDSVSGEELLNNITDDEKIESSNKCFNYFNNNTNPIISIFNNIKNKLYSYTDTKNPNKVNNNYIYADLIETDITENIKDDMDTNKYIFLSQDISIILNIVNGNSIFPITYMNDDCYYYINKESILKSIHNLNLIGDDGILLDYDLTKLTSLSLVFMYILTIDNTINNDGIKTRICELLTILFLKNFTLSNYSETILCKLLYNYELFYDFNANPTILNVSNFSNFSEFIKTTSYENKDTMSDDSLLINETMCCKEIYSNIDGKKKGNTNNDDDFENFKCKDFFRDGGIHKYHICFLFFLNKHITSLKTNSDITLLKSNVLGLNIYGNRIVENNLDNFIGLCFKNIDISKFFDECDNRKFISEDIKTIVIQLLSESQSTKLNEDIYITMFQNNYDIFDELLFSHQPTIYKNFELIITVLYSCKFMVDNKNECAAALPDTDYTYTMNEQQYRNYTMSFNMNIIKFIRRYGGLHFLYQKVNSIKSESSISTLEYNATRIISRPINANGYNLFCKTIGDPIKVRIFSVLDDQDRFTVGAPRHDGFPSNLSNSVFPLSLGPQPEPEPEPEPEFLQVIGISRPASPGPGPQPEPEPEIEIPFKTNLLEKSSYSGAFEDFFDNFRTETASEVAFGDDALSQQQVIYYSRLLNMELTKFLLTYANKQIEDINGVHKKVSETLLEIEHGIEDFQAYQTTYTLDLKHIFDSYSRREHKKKFDEGGKSITLKKHLKIQMGIGMENQPTKVWLTKANFNTRFDPNTPTREVPNIDEVQSGSDFVDILHHTNTRIDTGQLITELIKQHNGFKSLLQGKLDLLHENQKYMFNSPFIQKFLKVDENVGTYVSNPDGITYYTHYTDVLGDIPQELPNILLNFVNPPNIIQIGAQYIQGVYTSMGMTSRQIFGDHRDYNSFVRRQQEISDLAVEVNNICKIIKAQQNSLCLLQELASNVALSPKYTEWRSERNMGKFKIGDSASELRYEVMIGGVGTSQSLESWNDFVLSQHNIRRNDNRRTLDRLKESLLDNTHTDTVRQQINAQIQQKETEQELLKQQVRQMSEQLAGQLLTKRNAAKGVVQEFFYTDDQSLVMNVDRQNLLINQLWRFETTINNCCQQFENFLPSMLGATTTLTSVLVYNFNPNPIVSLQTNLGSSLMAGLSTLMIDYNSIAAYRRNQGIMYDQFNLCNKYLDDFIIDLVKKSSKLEDGSYQSLNFQEGIAFSTFLDKLDVIKPPRSFYYAEDATHYNHDSSEIGPLPISLLPLYISQGRIIVGTTIVRLDNGNYLDNQGIISPVTQADIDRMLSIINKQTTETNIQTMINLYGKGNPAKYSDIFYKMYTTDNRYGLGIKRRINELKNIFKIAFNNHIANNWVIQSLNGGNIDEYEIRPLEALSISIMQDITMQDQDTQIGIKMTLINMLLEQGEITNPNDPNDPNHIYVQYGVNLVNEYQSSLMMCERKYNSNCCSAIGKLINPYQRIRSNFRYSPVSYEILKEQINLRDFNDLSLLTRYPRTVTYDPTTDSYNMIPGCRNIRECITKQFPRDLEIEMYDALYPNILLHEYTDDRSNSLYIRDDNVRTVLESMSQSVSSGDPNVKFLNKQEALSFIYNYQEPFQTEVKKFANTGFGGVPAIMGGFVGSSIRYSNYENIASITIPILCIVGAIYLAIARKSEPEHHHAEPEHQRDDDSQSGSSSNTDNNQCDSVTCDADTLSTHYINISGECHDNICNKGNCCLKLNIFDADNGTQCNDKCFTDDGKNRYCNVPGDICSKNVITQELGRKLLREYGPNMLPESIQEKGFVKPADPSLPRPISFEMTDENGIPFNTTSNVMLDIYGQEEGFMDTLTDMYRYVTNDPAKPWPYKLNKDGNLIIYPGPPEMYSSLPRQQSVTCCDDAGGKLNPASFKNNCATKIDDDSSDRDGWWYKCGCVSGPLDNNNPPSLYRKYNNFMDNFMDTSGSLANSADETISDVVDVDTTTIQSVRYGIQNVTQAMLFGAIKKATHSSEIGYMLTNKLVSQKSLKAFGFGLNCEDLTNNDCNKCLETSKNRLQIFGESGCIWNRNNIAENILGKEDTSGNTNTCQS